MGLYADLVAAASWDKDAMYRRAKAIGEEARGKGINTQFGPGVNLMRTPQAGRAFECTSSILNEAHGADGVDNGPDPYLAGVAARQHVLGCVILDRSYERRTES